MDIIISSPPKPLLKLPITLFTYKPHRLSLNCTKICRHPKKSLTITICCKLRTTQDKIKSENDSAENIMVSGRAPPLLADEGAGKIGQTAKSNRGAGFLKSLNRFSRKVLAVLSNLPLAIAEMLSLVVLMILGTLIEQGFAPEFYFRNYPEENPVLGFFTWRWVLTLGFDHMFSSPIFLGLLFLLAASLMACSYTNQIPMFKAARRWSFLHSAETIRKMEVSDTLPRASIQDLGVILTGAGYEVFLKGPSLYAFKGLVSRLAPVGVHLAILLVMGGGTLSAAGSFRGSVTVPQGLNFVIGDVLNPSGFLSTPTKDFNTEVHVNSFYMDYYESGEVSQFHSDLSLFDLNGKEIMRKTISVNDPLRYGGITMYQTDWSFSALQILRNDEGPFNLPMAPLKVNRDQKLFGSFLPVGDADSPKIKGISMLARDLQSIVIYDQEGKFAGVRRPNSQLPIVVDGTKIVIVDVIGSTGLDLKTDPGVPVVYAGFGAVMLTSCLSFLSHSQIWGLQDGTTLIIGGKTNRLKADFPDKISRMLDWVPEIVDKSLS